ncbi:MAG: amidohydrolase family protein [Anaerolineae bacterium]|nr:amidohydrolase family protein [Anaerolineae bacterium]
MTSAPNLHLTNLRLPNGDMVHLSIENGLISDITSANHNPNLPDHAESIDAAGRLLFPGFVDAHAHMDKSLLGLPWYRNEVGPSLTDKIDNERRYRVEQGIDSYAQSSHVAQRMIAAGTTHVRTFVDIDTEIGLSGFDGVMRMRDELRDDLTVQVVAFPQSGMLARPGTVALMEAALRNGAQVVGGLDPSTIDRDPKGHLDTIFSLAARYNADVDVHLHEPAELGALSVELIAERTAALGWQGRVVISHAFCLGGVDEAYTGKLIELLLKNDIAIMSHGPSGSRAAPPVKRLHQAGVRLCAGNDGIRDTWGPLNMPDMLLRAFLIAYRNNFRRDDELEIALHMCSYGGANVMGAQNYGLAVGSPADLVIVDGQNHLEAMIERPPRWLVMKRGKRVVSARI